VIKPCDRQPLDGLLSVHAAVVSSGNCHLHLWSHSTCNMICAIHLTTTQYWGCVLYSSTCHPAALSFGILNPPIRKNISFLGQFISLIMSCPCVTNQNDRLQDRVIHFETFLRVFETCLICIFTQSIAAISSQKIRFSFLLQLNILLKSCRSILWWRWVYKDDSRDHGPRFSTYKYNVEILNLWDDNHVRILLFWNS